ncbi:aldo/keto reductase [Paenibacillus jilunlii]|uniref:Oxidoreductase n=1 Tax=Paenibacillus jilunlii TaxID=682956 RepID=A0A1G9J642_9BACL|nr:aldo/keto reductase [Paenibacillus jilunlii]KWX74772.1 oxidoreductase [Paenibacillus jilunlii]SDL32752.1 Predicted oxidoreductase [Paenibacillus jilunlii]
MRNGSKLMLGTAQLGTKYGIANVAGMPSRQKSCELIKYAVTAGIGYLDTAPGYGESEKMIGECLKHLNVDNKPVIVTKLPSVQTSGFKTEEERNNFVYSSIFSSLDNLKLSALDRCLLHDPMDMNYQNGEIINILRDLKQRRIIHKIGVSVYNPQDIEMYLNLGCFDSIQVPINLFDQRLIRNGMLEQLSEKGIEIFVRSIYLQGLLLMAPEHLPDQLKQAKKPLERLAKYSEETGISIKELSFLFVRDLPGVSKIIIGCETIDQLKDNLKMMELPPLKKEMIKEINQLFLDIPIKIIDPRMWK